MNTIVSFAAIPLLFILILGGCKNAQQKKDIQGLIEDTNARFVPDSRVDQFDIRVIRSSNSLVLFGETTLPEAKKALLDSISNMKISVLDSIEVLPSSGLGEEIYGLVTNSVANIRSEPRHSAQLATQALLGMPLKILKKSGGWYYVRTPDDYLSWVDGGGIHRINKESYESWKNADKIIYLETYGFSYKEPSTSSEKVSDLAAGNILKLESEAGAYYKAEYPDGRIAYVPKDEAKPLAAWENELAVTQQSLVETAKTMMGIPYLWGGTSTKGVDCSGFTKTVYFMNGMIIPRDASQQVHAGELVDDGKDWNKFEVGDLLFFGVPASKNKSRRVVHVGMWIGHGKFIHSSGKVRISSVYPDSSEYDEYNVNRYLEARRYLENMQGNIIQTGAMYDELK